MAEPKAQTIQQRFGFADRDLKTPKHDEIMLWLDANYELIVNRLRGNQRWDPNYIEHYLGWCEKQVLRAGEIITTQLDHLHAKQSKLTSPATPAETQWEKQQAKDVQYRIARFESHLAAWRKWERPSSPPPPWSIRMLGKTWEHPIKSGNFVVGFIDMKIDYVLPDLELEGSPSRDLVDHEWYPPAPPDLPASWVMSHHNHRSLYIEAKSSIPSLGEAIRQIQMYKTYDNLGEYVICCPDDRFAEQLRSQDIEFLKYEP